MTTPHPITLTRGIPPAHMIPYHLIKAGTPAAIDTYHDKALQYGTAWGFSPLRQWLSTELNQPLEQILIGNGSISLLGRIAHTFVKAGDVVLVESPTYDRAILLFEQAGAEVLSVPVTSDGVDLARFADLVRQRRPRLAYLINDFNNPTGSCTSPEKRRAIAELAQETNMLIVDDGAYAFLRYTGEPVPPMRHYAPNHTLSLGSFSKLLAPGLRTGWVSAPPDYVKRIATVIENASISPNHFSQAVIERIVTTPEYRTHHRFLLDTYGQLAQLASDLFTEHLTPRGVQWIRPEGGFFVGLHFPHTATPIWERSTKLGLTLLNGDAFFVRATNTNFVRFPFCSLTLDEMPAVVERLAALVE